MLYWTRLSANLPLLRFETCSVRKYYELEQLLEVSALPRDPRTYILLISVQYYILMDFDYFS